MIIFVILAINSLGNFILIRGEQTILQHLGFLLRNVILHPICSHFGFRSVKFYSLYELDHSFFLLTVSLGIYFLL